MVPTGFMSCSAESSAFGPFSLNMVTSRSRSASVVQRLMVMSTGVAPLRPTVLMLTATAVKRSRGEFDAVWAAARRATGEQSSGGHGGQRIESTSLQACVPPV